MMISLYWIQSLDAQDWPTERYGNVVLISGSTYELVPVFVFNPSVETDISIILSKDEINYPFFASLLHWRQFHVISICWWIIIRNCPKDMRIPSESGTVETEIHDDFLEFNIIQSLDAQTSENTSELVLVFVFNSLVDTEILWSLVKMKLTSHILLRFFIEDNLNFKTPSRKVNLKNDWFCKQRRLPNSQGIAGLFTKTLEILRIPMWTWVEIILKNNTWLISIRVQ